MHTAKQSRRMPTVCARMVGHMTLRILPPAVLMSMSVELRALVERTACVQICQAASSVSASLGTRATLKSDVSVSEILLL